MQYSLFALMAASAMAMPQAASPEEFAVSPAPSATQMPNRLNKPAGLAVVAYEGELPATAASSTTVAPNLAAAATTGPLSLTITNMYTKAVSVDYASNVGGPKPVSTPPPSIAQNGKDVAVFPVGYSGNIGIGNNYNVNNSLIEYTVGSGSVNIDVSYVDGFSVPIVCSCSGAVATGCNINLFGTGTKCGTETSGPVCVNPDHYGHDGGPATPFFAPCAHKAFTYPDDNAADATCATKSITCCIGSSCPANNKN